MKILIGNQKDNDDRLSNAIVNAQDGDVIELLPGSYFTKDNPLICTITNNISIIGKTYDNEAVKLYASITVVQGATVIFKNLLLSYTANDENTLSAYDASKVYGDNVTIDRNTSDSWDTIYGQNSYFSFKESQIGTGNKTKAIGLSLDHSKLFAQNTTFAYLFAKNSTIYLKNSVIFNKLELRRKTNLFFRDLQIDTTFVYAKNDLAVKSNSSFQGQELRFYRQSPNVRILKSNFNVEKFNPQLNKIHFKYDKTSKVLADKQTPKNDFAN
jgi:hypothetical protein